MHNFVRCRTSGAVPTAISTPIRSHEICEMERLLGTELRARDNPLIGLQHWVLRGWRLGALQRGGWLAEEVVDAFPELPRDLRDQLETPALATDWVASIPASIKYF